MKTRLAAACAALLVAGAPLSGQSLFNSAGLGLPLDAVDGRSRALGSFGIGLWGSSLLPTDPGAIGMLVVPTGVIAGQPSWVDYSRSSGETGSFQGNRFPLLAMAYPALSGVMSVSFGAFLDQRFQGERPVSIDLLGGPADGTDVFDQEGAVSQVTLGYSRRLGDDAAVGVTVGRYAGTVVRRLVRDFGDLDVPGDVSTYEAGGRWSYSGHSFTGGGAADIGTVLRVAAALTLSTSLDAEASDDTEGSDRSFDLPLQARVGASAVLAPGLMIAASLVHADWSGLDAELGQAGDVRGTSGLGVGVELSRARVLGKQAPLRFGFRTNELPFSVGGGDASERVFTGGLGLTLNETSGVVLAGVDLSLERGRRTGGSLTENFWRATVSLRVSGF